MEKSQAHQIKFQNNANQVTKELNKLGLLNWFVIEYGLERNWIDSTEIANHAQNLLSSNAQINDKNIELLASAEYLDDEEIKRILKTITKTKNKCTEDFFSTPIDIWRLGFLIALEKSNSTDENKINELQGIYAEFNYPEDMIGCSIYTPREVDPLKALNQLINDLKLKLGAISIFEASDKNKNLHIVINHDCAVGYYTVVYPYNSKVSIADYLYDSLEEAFSEIEERYKISKKDFIKQ